MITSTLAARTALGPAMHISHAPPAPYFGIVGTDPSPNNSVNTWPGDSGGYSAVYAGINASIDWVAVQVRAVASPHPRRLAIACFLD